MSFTLDKVVPWGRSFDEYAAMFALSKMELEKRILGCGDGPAGFNCVLTRRGGHIISADPIYHFSVDEIKNRIDATYKEIVEQIKENQDEFVWNHISSIEELCMVRIKAMGEFLSDYQAGRKEGRYVEASLPKLPFKDSSFDLALCSHFLFLYSEQFSEYFHVQSIRELCRVSSEVRVFPLMELGARKSRHLGNIVGRLHKEGFEVSIEKVSYEFQKGGNEMIRIKVQYK